MTSLLLLVLVIGEVCIAIKDFHTPEFRSNVWWMAYTLGSPILYAVCAAYLYRGANWARIFFYAVCLPLIVLGPWVFVRIVVFALCAWRLASWRANYFFTGKDTRPERRHPSVSPQQTKRSHRGTYDY